MTFASILFVTGLVGIGVMGFIVSKGQTAKKNQYLEGSCTILLSTVSNMFQLR
jgi:hypothetical protein